MGALNFLRPLWAIFAPRTGESLDRVEAPAAGGGGGAYLGDAERDMEASIGSAVDLAMSGSADSAGGLGPDDRSARELFADIASNFSQPIKNFIIDLKRGTATKEWIEICMPVMGSVIHGAVSLDLESEAQYMVEFRDALAQAESSQGSGFDQVSRDLILSRYATLIAVLPDTFTIGDENRRRESIIIHSLLRQIPDVGHVTFEKLYSAGLTSLEALFLVNKGDLAAASGVPLWLCERICDKVNEHREQLQSVSAKTAPLDHQARLVELVQELRRQHDEFQRISKQGSATPQAAAEKRECLRARQACGLQITVLLAEMGEVGLVEALRTLAVGRRIELLDSYLAGAPNGNASDFAGATTTNHR